MEQYRILENKFYNQINLHLKKAVPSLLNSDYLKISASSDYEDQYLSFDMSFSLNFVVSVRIRSNKYLKYQDMTIRHKSKNGGLCEIDKIKNGLSQVYFYAYMNLEETDIVKVRIVDVKAIRELINIGLYDVRKNADGTELAAFKFIDIYNHGGAIYKFN